MSEPGSAAQDTVGAYLRDAREKAGLTQAQVAARSGLSRAAIANTEGGRQRLTFESWAAVARALNLDLNEIAARVGLPTPPPEPHVVTIRTVLEIYCETCDGASIGFREGREDAQCLRKGHIAEMLEKEAGDAR